MGYERRLPRTMFHYAVNAYYGRQAQARKVIEELSELSLALYENDKEHITEELADVEIVLPYLKIIFPIECKIKITDMGRFDYHTGSRILSELIYLKLDDQSPSHELTRAISAMVSYVCMSLYNIYKDFDITTDEVDRWKEEKMRRTMKRIAKSMIGEVN